MEKNQWDIQINLNHDKYNFIGKLPRNKKHYYPLLPTKATFQFESPIEEIPSHSILSPLYGTKLVDTMISTMNQEKKTLKHTFNKDKFCYTIYILLPFMLHSIAWFRDLLATGVNLKDFTNEMKHGVIAAISKIPIDKKKELDTTSVDTTVPTIENTSKHIPEFKDLLCMPFDRSKHETSTSQRPASSMLSENSFESELQQNKHSCTSSTNNIGIINTLLSTDKTSELKLIENIFKNNTITSSILKKESNTINGIHHTISNENNSDTLVKLWNLDTIWFHQFSIATDNELNILHDAFILYNKMYPLAEPYIQENQQTNNNYLVLPYYGKESRNDFKTFVLNFVQIFYPYLYNHNIKKDINDEDINLKNEEIYNNFIRISFISTWSMNKDARTAIYDENNNIQDIIDIWKGLELMLAVQHVSSFIISTLLLKKKERLEKEYKPTNDMIKYYNSIKNFYPNNNDKDYFLKYFVKEAIKIYNMENDSEKIIETSEHICSNYTIRTCRELFYDLSSFSMKKKILRPVGFLIKKFNICCPHISRKINDKKRNNYNTNHHSTNSTKNQYHSRILSKESIPSKKDTNKSSNLYDNNNNNNNNNSKLTTPNSETSSNQQSFLYKLLFNEKKRKKEEPEEEFSIKKYKKDNIDLTKKHTNISRDNSYNEKDSNFSLENPIQWIPEPPSLRTNSWVQNFKRIEHVNGFSLGVGISGIKNSGDGVFNLSKKSIPARSVICSYGNDKISPEEHEKTDLDKVASVGDIGNCYVVVNKTNVMTVQDFQLKYGHRLKKYNGLIDAKNSISGKINDRVFQYHPDIYWEASKLYNNCILTAGCTFDENSNEKFISDELYVVSWTDIPPNNELFVAYGTEFR